MLKCNAYAISSFPRRRESRQAVCVRIIVSDAKLVNCLDSRLRGNGEV